MLTTFYRNALDSTLGRWLGPSGVHQVTVPYPPPGEGQGAGNDKGGGGYQSGPGMGLPAAKATPGTVLSAGEMALLEHGLGKARVPSPEDGSDSDSSSLSVDSADEALVPVGPWGPQWVRFASPQLAPTAPATTVFIALSSECHLVFIEFSVDCSSAGVWVQGPFLPLPQIGFAGGGGGWQHPSRRLQQREWGWEGRGHSICVRVQAAFWGGPLQGAASKEMQAGAKGVCRAVPPPPPNCRHRVPEGLCGVVSPYLSSAAHRKARQWA